MSRVDKAVANKKSRMKFGKQKFESTSCHITSHITTGLLMIRAHSCISLNQTQIFSFSSFKGWIIGSKFHVNESTIIMYSTKTIHKNIGQTYTSIGDPYKTSVEALPQR